MFEVEKILSVFLQIESRIYSDLLVKHLMKMLPACGIIHIYEIQKFGIRGAFWSESVKNVRYDVLDNLYLTTYLGL